jgi:hypothetical protein
MRKWWVMALGLCVLAPCASAIADNTSNPASAGLFMICSPLIEKGNINPPEPADNLQTVQLCQNSCSTIYQPFAAPGHEADALKKINDCKKSLNSLYFSSVAKINTDQLNQQLKKQGPDVSIFEKMAKMIQQQHTSASPTEDNTKPDSSAESANTSPSSGTAAPSNSTPPVSYDNINW